MSGNMAVYKPTIGLEIHAELKTRTKMFCNSKNDPDEKRPNVNICPVCMGHPGTLPVINKEAVRQVLRVGAALGGELADLTEFDRKNYFYPDLPKGYQISQYKYPLVSGGSLRGVSITRVHLEEDTARSIHESGNYSLVDFNRAGIPLMELVSEPVIESAKQAGSFARELQLLLRYLGSGEANMEKGEMRVEANVSVSRDNNLGTKVEVKNLNSFRSVERAIVYEIDRQVKQLESGEEIQQETRGWDESKQQTFSQRIKEESSDYRYFPDPDLPKLKISEIQEFSKKALEKTLPELPWQKRERYRSAFGVKDEDIEVFVQNPAFAAFFEESVSKFVKNEKLVQTATNYLTSDLVGLMKSEGKSFADMKMSSLEFTELIEMISDGEISSRGAKEILAHIALNGGSPKKIAEKEGLLQKSDEGELTKIVETIVSEHADVVEDYKKGKEASLKFLIGQGMKLSKGAANPEVLKKLILDRIS